jgi:5-methylcytosine-specific restriction enzyme A
MTDRDYRYTGEGQHGKMEMVRGNRAIYQHEKDTRELHLFEKHNGGEYEYLGQFEYVSHEQQSGSDITGAKRDMIVFRLRRI